MDDWLNCPVGNFSPQIDEIPSFCDIDHVSFDSPVRFDTCIPKIDTQPVQPLFFIEPCCLQPTHMRTHSQPVMVTPDWQTRFDHFQNLQRMKADRMTQSHALMLGTMMYQNQYQRQMKPEPRVPDTEHLFEEAIKDPSLVFDPARLGVIPTQAWPEGEPTFGSLVTEFFQKRNSSNCRFIHKLFNALQIAKAAPNLCRVLGVEWIAHNILRVDKYAFARLLKIRTIDGSLFHQQGNFPSHGFVELNETQAREMLTQEDLADVDYESVRLLMHKDGLFNRESQARDVDDCKYVSVRKR